MARIFPKPHAAGLALVFGIFLEGVQLLIGDSFQDHAHEPDSGGKFLEESERRTRVEAGQQKGKRENDYQ